jgi:anti-anti-sigma regulatory factor
MATSPLVIRIEQHLPITVVALAGTLTQQSAAQLRQTMLKCLAECPDAIMIDLSGLRVDGDLPLVVFRAVRRHAASWPAIPVLVCSPPPALADQLARVSVDGVLPVFPDRASGLAVIRSPSIARADRQLTPSVGAPEQARTLMVEICEAWNLPELVDPARLVASELVTNAILHAWGPPQLSAVLRRAYLHLIVRDESPDPPVRRAIPPMAGLTRTLSGWGMNLVAVTAHAWGHLANDTGKAVWAMLRCPQRPSASVRALRPHLVRPQCLHPRH